MLANAREGPIFWAIKWVCITIAAVSLVAIAITGIRKCLQRYLSRFQGVEFVFNMFKKIAGISWLFCKSGEGHVDGNIAATFSTPIAVVTAAVSSDINYFSAFAGNRDYKFCLFFVCHVVINVFKSVANHLMWCSQEKSHVIAILANHFK